MKYKTILQVDEKSCGVTCLAMICEYYGIKNVSMAIIRNFAQTDQNGNNISSLKMAAEKLHMEAKALAVNKQAMLSQSVNYPMIVHTLVDGLYPHYMVAFEANDKKILIGDPAQGEIEMTWEEFDKIWTKKVILLKPTENFSENKKYKRNYKIIINLFKKFKFDIIKIMAFTTITSLAAATIAYFYSYLIDNILPENNIQMLIKMILAFVAIIFITFELKIIQQKISIKFNKKLDKELVLKMYNRIVNLPMSYFSSRTTGDIMTRYGAADGLRDFLTRFTLDIIMDFGYAIWALILLLTTNWQMCVIAIVMQELLMLVQFIYTKKIRELNRKIIHSSTEVDSFANQTFSATETIKSYVSEAEMEKAMDKKYKEYQKDNYKTQETMTMQNSFSETIQNIGTISILAVLGIFVMSGSITVGELVKCYMYYSYIFTPIDTLMGMKEDLVEMTMVLERLDDVLAVETEEELDKKKKPLKENIETIKFDHVSFKYGFRPNTLNDIDLEINKGDSVGIIGGSGCRKNYFNKTYIRLL